MRTVPSRFPARAITICAAITASLWAAKKPVTIDALMNGPRGFGGGQAVWSPDGTRFVHQEHGRVLLYDPAKKSDTELFKMEDLERAAVPVPEAKTFGWQNRRVEEESLEWSGDGQSLLVAVKGDLFLWRFGPKKWEQLTKTPEAESSPKISPDGRYVAFRRNADLYLLDTSSWWEGRLTRDGSATLLNGELDWVYPEELEIGTAMWW